jgi:hypothetical protein
MWLYFSTPLFLYLMGTVSDVDKNALLGDAGQFLLHLVIVVFKQFGGEQTDGLAAFTAVKIGFDSMFKGFDL